MIILIKALIALNMKILTDLQAHQKNTSNLLVAARCETV